MYIIIYIISQRVSQKQIQFVVDFSNIYMLKSAVFTFKRGFVFMAIDLIKMQQIKINFNELELDFKKLENSVNLKNLIEQVNKLELQTNDANFWADSKNAKSVVKRLSLLKNKIQNFQNVARIKQDCDVLFELVELESDEEAFNELDGTIKKLNKVLKEQLMAVLLGGEFDSNNAILTLHAGAGGVEAMDWVEMLFRMYSRWVERRSFKEKILNQIDGEEAGIKSVSFLVEGLNAYGYLKSEAGVHRLVRVSPFDASGRRHTSFASIEVLPELDDDCDVEIRDDEIKMDVFRASGAGGQHVNKTSSAVRLTHIPTGIVASCQNERSQLQNRTIAMKILKSKLVEIKQRQHLEKIEDIKGEQKEIAWGSQIRSYVFMPYTMVKDHRTNFEDGNISSVMDGNLDGFINAYLSWQAKTEEKC